MPRILSAMPSLLHIHTSVAIASFTAMVQGGTEVNEEILYTEMIRAKNFLASKLLGGMLSQVERKRDPGKDVLFVLSNMVAMMQPIVHSVDRMLAAAQNAGK